MSFWHLSFPHTFLTSVARAVRFCSSTCHLLHGPSRKRPSTKPPACPAAVTVFLPSASSIAIAPSANGQQRKFLMHIVYAIRTAPTQYIMSPAPHGDQSITSELRLRLSGSPRSSWASSPPPPRPHPALHPTGRALEPLAPVPHPQRLEHRVQAAPAERVAADHQQPRHDRHVAVVIHADRAGPRSRCRNWCHRRWRRSYLCNRL